MAAVGQTLPMIDAQERVSGRINYVLNVELPGMLSGKILRSPFPHARVVRVDASRAERLAGVGAVLTRSDFIGPTGFNGKYGRIFRDQTVVALDKVRFVGDPVAAVAAANDDIAAEALSLIEVEYEELPAVFDEEEALKPSRAAGPRSAAGAAADIQQIDSGSPCRKQPLQSLQAASRRCRTGVSRG